ncbi:MAG: hypothetical protein MPEBLZ_01564 [Candidatus Methanoperedens nitroreducens]|uniref:Uncharacterized protein n=1 Tax=Candidatus Methanoperedens nitratireducens TaxID=1392998 RepID=A0A0P8AHE0_9EURY|nr:MAG: hypothetical protein MPEBLZ_01564 [Candidatus Methanoperedens sp. BLZ1]
MSINEIMLAVFLINLPFGYIRGNAARFSRKWIMAIHIPVPFIFLIRIFSGLNWTIIPFAGSIRYCRTNSWRKVEKI